MTSGKFSPPTSFTLAAVLGALWLAMLVGGAGAVDGALLVALYAGGRPALADFARLVTLLGNWEVATLAAAAGALVLVRRREGLPALVLFAGVLLGRLLVQLQKYEFGRLRPDSNPHLVEVHNLSFPSGHSANAAMTYVALALLLPATAKARRRWLVAAAAVTLLVGFSRVMVGVHWPSDVVGGWSFGLMWAMLLHALAERLRQRRPKARS